MVGGVRLLGTQNVRTYRPGTMQAFWLVLFFFVLLSRAVNFLLFLLASSSPEVQRSAHFSKRDFGRVEGRRDVFMLDFFPLG